MRIVIAAIAATALLASSVALACSCAGFGSATAHAAAADAIFRGRAIEWRTVPGARAAVTTFEILEPLKSPTAWAATPQRVDIVHGIDDASCGVRFSQGRDTLVAARFGEDGQLHTSLCFLPQFPDSAYREALGVAPQ